MPPNTNDCQNQNQLSALSNIHAKLVQIQTKLSQIQAKLINTKAKYNDIQEVVNRFQAICQIQGNVDHISEDEIQEAVGRIPVHIALIEDAIGKIHDIICPFISGQIQATADEILDCLGRIEELVDQIESAVDQISTIALLGDQ